LEKIGHAESLEKLRELLSGSKENTNQTLEKAKKQLEAAYLERIKAMSNITRLAQEIDQEKKRFLQVEANTPTHDQEVAKLTEQWKELQKQNAEKRAALEARMNVSISSANDCKDILHNQTQTIQKLSEQQKSLEVSQAKCAYERTTAQESAMFYIIIGQKN
jgi:hypothetical protein